MAEKKAQPRYLQNTADGSTDVKLYAGEDVEAAMAHGWKEPTFRRPNGEAWNPADVEEDIVSPEQNQADMQKLDGKRQEKIAARKAKEAEEAEKQAEASRKESAANATPRQPDFRVEVIETVKDKK